MADALRFGDIVWAEIADVNGIRKAARRFHYHA